MSFERPTLSTLIKRAVSSIELLLPGADARLRVGFENVIAKVVAAAAHGLHGHLLFLSKQIFPDTAESQYLRRWAAIWKTTPKDPSKASGSISVTASVATPMLAGTKWQRSDGLLFETDALVTVTGTMEVAVTAELVGANGNTDTSTALTITSPIANITSPATVAGSGLTGGADAETDAALLVRVLLRIQTPPSGGGPSDYVRWAKEVSGVTRAWEYPAELGLGTVTVRFATDGESSPIPSGSKVAEVQAKIDGIAPVTSVPTVVAPIDTPLALSITIVPNTAEVKAAVTAELEAFLLRAAKPGSTLLWSQINEAISIATGETDHVLTVPATDVVHTTGQMPTLGTITWS